jgi:hypothetical protein
MKRRMVILLRMVAGIPNHMPLGRVRIPGKSAWLRFND